MSVVVGLDAVITLEAVVAANIATFAVATGGAGVVWEIVGDTNFVDTAPGCSMLAGAAVVISVYANAKLEATSV